MDLDAVCVALPRDAEYRPEVFPGLVLRLKNPKTATLLFRTGSIVCTGAKSEGEAKRAIGRVAEMLRDAGIVVVGKPKAEVQNIVATGELGARVHLERASTHLRRTIYEPELFPGLVYRPSEDSSVTFLVFTSGKFVCAGARSQAEVHDHMDKLRTDLRREQILST